jgi:hypothetical protein
MAVDGPFPQSALDANKSGRLTDSQRQLIRALARGVRKSELTGAVISAGFGIFIGSRYHSGRRQSPSPVPGVESGSSADANGR